MDTTPRLGQTMRLILTVLFATRGTRISTSTLAELIGASESATRHSVARLADSKLVADHGSAQRRDWQITESGLDVLNAIWAKEGGAAGR